MPDEDAPRTSRRSAKADQAAEDELAAAELSRAAREAVRQPPDPRLEASFAKLGLWSVPDAPDAQGASGETERSRDSAPTTERGHDGAGDHADLRADLVNIRLATEDLRRRLDLAVRLEAVVIVLLALVILLVIVRAGS